jgi:probable phosphoglycerate mutase
MLAGMSNGAWAVLEQHRDRGWQIIDYNATTLPEPLDLPDDMASS